MRAAPCKGRCVVAASDVLLGAIEAVERGARGKVVLCMPDLFVDHLVTLPRWGEFQKQLASANLRGGGRVRSAGQRLVVGGNAFNTARALSRLGLAARFAGLTSQGALEFAKRETALDGARPPLDLSLVRTGGRASHTVALELGEERTNVQLNDPGSLDGLRLEDLGGEAREALGRADAVHLANWGQNARGGTALAAETLAAAKAAGALTFFDPSDLWGREKDTLELLRTVPASKDLDWLLVNEAELRELSRVLLLNAGGTSPCAHDDTEGQGREFTKRVESALAVHTAGAALAFRKGKPEGEARTAPLVPSRTTGAGDVWNAAFIAATLGGVPPQVRLEFAQAAARHFVTTTGPPPCLDDLRAGPAQAARAGA